MRYEPRPPLPVEARPPGAPCRSRTDTCAASRPRSAAYAAADALAVEGRGRETLRRRAHRRPAEPFRRRSCSPSLPANNDRPRCTASADRVRPITDAKLAATYGSSTTAQRRLAGWRAPCRASARSAASFPMRSPSRSSGVRATPTAKSRHAIAPLAGERIRVGVGLGAARTKRQSRPSWPARPARRCPHTPCPRRWRSAGPVTGPRVRSPAPAPRGAPSSSRRSPAPPARRRRWCRPRPGCPRARRAPSPRPTRWPLRPAISAPARSGRSRMP